MKNLKKPNYNQKQRIAKAKVDPMKVFVKSDDGTTITVLDRETNKVFEITGKKFKEIGESD